MDDTYTGEHTVVRDRGTAA